MKICENRKHFYECDNMGYYEECLKENEIMTLNELKNNWNLSEYNEGTKEQIDYYFQEEFCNIGGTAYLYNNDEDALIEMEIVYYIARSEDEDAYDSFDEDILLVGEDKYNADTSCEFITDNDCYLVWFKYKMEDDDVDVYEKTVDFVKNKKFTLRERAKKLIDYYYDTEDRSDKEFDTLDLALDLLNELSESKNEELKVWYFWYGDNLDYVVSFGVDPEDAWNRFLKSRENQGCLEYVETDIKEWNYREFDKDTFGGALLFY